LREYRHERRRGMHQTESFSFHKYFIWGFILSRLSKRSQR
jgi:hypothetical protein